MAKVEKKTLDRKGWSNFFELIGEVKINDYTYQIDQTSNSGFCFNRLNLGVDCGKHGTVYAEMMGGYFNSPDKKNILNVHGSKTNDDGRVVDDYDNRITVDWEDRFNEDIVKEIGNGCFTRIGIELDAKNNLFNKKFLSTYDAIAYLKQTLVSGTVVRITGNLSYSRYNDKIQVHKNIKSIVLSRADSPDKYCANFTQTMLIGSDSILKPDREKGILPIAATVIDYAKMWGDKEVKTNVPYIIPVEYEMDFSDKARAEKIVSLLFKVKRGYNEITFEGDFMEGGAVIDVTIDDIPDDIKLLITLGFYTEEDALKKCAESRSTEKRMVIRRPALKRVEDGETTRMIIQKTENKYSEEDLVLDFMLEKDEEEDSSSLMPSDDDSDWLSKLDA